MEEIIEKYNMKLKASQNDIHPPESHMDNANHANLMKKVAESNRQLRQMRGEELQGLSLKELHKLEETLQSGLITVAEKKRAMMLETINELQEKSQHMLRENEQLREKLMTMRMPKPTTNGSENTASNDGEMSDLNSTTSDSEVHIKHDDSSETPVQLGFITFL